MYTQGELCHEKCVDFWERPHLIGSFTHDITLTRREIDGQWIDKLSYGRAIRQAGV